MRGLINDWLRTLNAFSIQRLGLVRTIVQRVRASVFFWSQKRLTRSYGITSDTPMLSFRPELELLIENAAARLAETRIRRYRRCFLNHSRVRVHASLAEASS